VFKALAIASTRDIMSTEALLKPEKDYTSEVEKQIPEAEALAKVASR
jgi:hypothetical protein